MVMLLGRWLCYGDAVQAGGCVMVMLLGRWLCYGDAVQAGGCVMVMLFRQVAVLW